MRSGEQEQRVKTAGQTFLDRPHLGLLKDASFRPVFILGSARSGTTILYQLLAATERFNWVTAYHLIKYDELLANHLGQTTERAKQELSDRFRDLGIAGARFDGVEVDPDFPEEYGWLLDRQQVSSRTLARFIELCRKVQFVSRPDRLLLLKNPWDSRRFLYLKKVLPESRFIFIHRNPVDVVQSLLEAMRLLLRARNPYHALLNESYDRLMEQPLRRSLARLLFSPRLGVGETLVGWQVARTARYFLDHVGSLAETDFVSVRYEDLGQNPSAVVNRILRFLGQAENPELRYEDFIRESQPRVPSERARAMLRSPKLKPYLAYCGYEAESTPGAERYSAARHRASRWR
jgi:hypothetical protein